MRSYRQVGGLALAGFPLETGCLSVSYGQAVTLSDVKKCPLNLDVLWLHCLGRSGVSNHGIASYW